MMLAPSSRSVSAGFGELAERLDGAAAEAAGLGQHLQRADVGLELAADLQRHAARQLERALVGDRAVVFVFDVLDREAERQKRSDRDQHEKAQTGPQ